jgi:eukaryotic-like serine/threonine-protein kinase
VTERERLVPKVLDFGIAKVTEAPMPPASGQTATQSALITFSPGYAAPEQVAMTRTGPWTDVHALALLVVEVLSDAQVYGWSDSVPILSEILGSERPSPARRGVQVGPWEAILLRALALNPKDRQASAGVLLKELTQSVEAAEQHFTFQKQYGSVNSTLPLAPSNSPAAAPSATTTTPSARPAATASEAATPRRRWLLALSAVVILAAAFMLLRQPSSASESDLDARREGASHSAATTPATLASVPAMSVPPPAAPAAASSSPTLEPHPAVSAPVRAAPVGHAAASHAKPLPSTPAPTPRAPTRLAPTESFE